MFKRPSTRLAAILTALISISACGGGGGGTTPPPGTTPPGTTPPPGGNQAPTVTIAEKKPAMELTTVTLTAKGEDADGDTLAYIWTQTAGTPVEITGADSAAISFNAPKVKNSETLAFEVIVNDGEETASADLEVIIEEANGVVYSAVEETRDIQHIYFYHPALETPHKLNPNLDTSNHETNFASPIFLLPDHRHVVYLYDIQLKDGSHASGLYRAALDVSSETDITGDIVENGRIRTVKLSPDGKWLAFTGDLETEGKIELFVVPADGSMPRRKLSGDAIVENGDVSASHFYWSPDSTQLLFGGDIRVDGRHEVFLADIAENNPVLISAEGDAFNKNNLFTTLVDGAPFSWSSDGEYIAFVEQANAAAQVELTTIRRNGSNRDTVLANDPSQRLKFEWSDQGKLAFIFEIENEWEDLFIYDPATGSEVWVGGARAIVDENGIGIGKVRDFQWSPDGEHLAFTLDNTGNVGMFVVPAGAESPDDRVRIDGRTAETATTTAFNPRGSWSYDSSRFVFTTRANGESRRLFSNTVDGIALVDISGNFADDIFGIPPTYCLSPDRQELLFFGRIEGDGSQHVYHAHAEKTGRLRITGDVGTDTDALKVYPVDDCWSPDGTQVLIRGDMEQRRLEQLFVVPADSVDGRDRIRVSNLLETDGNADGNPDGKSRKAIWVGPDAK